MHDEIVTEIQHQQLPRRAIKSIVLRLIGSIGRAYGCELWQTLGEILCNEYPHSEGRARSSDSRLGVDHS